MSFQLSPGVQVKEWDLTTSVPSVASTEGALAGLFRWGPVGKRILVSSEDNLVKVFGKPTNFNAETWWTAASFLAYTNRLYIVRAANTVGESPSAAVYFGAANNPYALVCGDARIFENANFVKLSTNTEIYRNTIDGMISRVVNSSTIMMNNPSDVIQKSPVITGTEKLFTANTTYVNTTTSSISFNTQENHGFDEFTLVEYTVTATNTIVPLGGLSHGGRYFVVPYGLDKIKLSRVYQGSIIPITIPLNADATQTHTFTKVQPTVIQCLPNTTFSAVAADGVVESYAKHVVRNADEFAGKLANNTLSTRLQDTNTYFEDTVKFIARYPGAIGNSLRVSICANSYGWASQVAMASNGATLTIGPGSNTANIVVVDRGTIDVLAKEITPNATMITANKIVFAAPHGFANGDVVHYRSFGQNTISASLEDYGTAYVYISDEETNPNPSNLQLVAVQGGNTPLVLAPNTSVQAHIISRREINTTTTTNVVFYPTAVNINPVTKRIYAVNNKFNDGDRVYYYRSIVPDPLNPGAVVTGLNNGYPYYIINSTQNSFSVAATLNGNAISVAVPVGTNTAAHVFTKTNSNFPAYLNARSKLISLANGFNLRDKLTIGNANVGITTLQVTNVSSITTDATDYFTVAIDTTRYETTPNLVLIDQEPNPIDGSYYTTGNLMVGDIITYTGNTKVVNAATTTHTGVEAVIKRIVNSSCFELTSNSVITAPGSTVIGVRQNYYGTAMMRVNFATPSRLYGLYSSSSNITRRWEFWNIIRKPDMGISKHVMHHGNNAINGDLMQLVVVDHLGKFTGIPGSPLEAYTNVSRATDAVGPDGSTIYWQNQVNKSSAYIWAVNDIPTMPSANALFLTNSYCDTISYQLGLGNDGLDEKEIPLSILANGYNLFKSPDLVDISFLLTGINVDAQLANYLIDNIAEPRMDCMVFVSPNRDAVVDNAGYELDAVLEFRAGVRGSSYAVMDSGYKMINDRYNDVYRWVPMNGDIAGLCAQTDHNRDAWWSPAGFARGRIKNVIKVAYDPIEAERDSLYPEGVNPVVTFPGTGVILYGDKTLLDVESAFTRINVRRLFIVLEKAISRASKALLFEFNDPFTRQTFLNMVNPFLEDVKHRRGIYDYKVVCDETNNTPEVIDRNEFVGDIYIKPARSINYITLNFVAVRTGVNFAEVIGKFGG